MPQPTNGFSPSVAQSPGSTSTALPRNRVEKPGYGFGESSQLARLSDDATGGAAAANLSANVAGSTVFSGQIPSALSLTPTQVGSLLSTDLVATVRSESSGDASAHADRVAGAASVKHSGAKIGRVAASSIHLTSTRHISAPLAEAKLDDFPGPNGDDLLAVVLPFDSASLERAVDHFFRQLDELEVRDLVGGDSTQVVFVSLGLATTAAALEVARRRLRQGTAGGKGIRVREAMATGDDLGFPDLPGSWSSRLT